MKRFLSSLIILIVLTSCTNEIKPVTFNITSIDTSFDATISATYDKATGASDLSKTINSNIENAIINTLSSSEGQSDLNNVLKGFNSEFVNFKKEFPDTSEAVWELSIETEIAYQSEDIITIVISTYEFEGGAHGNDKIKFLNLNAQSGEVFSQNDIVEINDTFILLAKEHFIKSLATKEAGLNIEDYFFGKPFQLPENIGFSDDGLVFLYNAYEVASYNQGYNEFIISFDEVAPFLKVN